MGLLYLYPCPFCQGTVFRVCVNVGKVVGLECHGCHKALPPFSKGGKIAVTGASRKGNVKSSSADAKSSTEKPTAIAATPANTSEPEAHSKAPIRF